MSVPSRQCLQRTATYGPISWLLAFRWPTRVSTDRNGEAQQLTGPLKKSLDVEAAVPATNLPAWALLAAIPLAVSGPGSKILSVSVMPSISTAEGGDIMV
jgi:hypothetical protein